MAQIKKEVKLPMGCLRSPCVCLHPKKKDHNSQIQKAKFKQTDVKPMTGERRCNSDNKIK